MMIHTEEEREIVREGGRRLGVILKKLEALVAPGVTTQDLEDEARRLIAAGGDTPATLNYTPKGSARPFPAALCVSINEEIVHGIPNENPRTLKEGDIVSIDCLLNHRGLITDSALTVPVGKTSKENMRLLRAVHEALSAGIKNARAGNRIGAIGSAIEAVAKKYGYQYPPELGGHGVGRAVHENPFIPNYDGGPDTDKILKEGMVIAIEPMMSRGTAHLRLGADGYTYSVTDGSPTAHFEHTVIITRGDAEVLTTRECTRGTKS